jgi:peptidoglycan/LPS O-acetylase OafA/YrhL
MWCKKPRLKPQKRYMALSKDNNLNAIRLFAALNVVYLHAVFHLKLPPFPRLFYDLMASFPGVLIFFIVSGFLVSDSYLNSTAGDFAIKRVLRIYPGLIVNIAIMEFLVFMTGGFSPTVSALNYLGFFSVYSLTAALPWAGHFFDSPYIGSGFFDHYPSGVLWTLSVELTFYLVLPLFLEIWRRSKGAGFFYLAGASGLSLYLTYLFIGEGQWQTFVSLSIGPYFWMFAIGVAARLSWSGIRSAFEGRAAYWLAAHLFLIFVSYQMLLPGAINFPTPRMIDFIRIFVLAGVILSVAFTLPNPSLLRGYDISYGVYLYHMLIIHTFVSLGLAGRFRYLLLALIGAILAGMASWILVERPAGRLKTLLRRRNPQTSQPDPLHMITLVRDVS